MLMIGLGPRFLPGTLCLETVVDRLDSDTIFSKVSLLTPTKRLNDSA